MYRNTKTTAKCIKLPNVGTLYPRFTEQGQILLNNYKLVTKGEKINNSQEISCSVVIFQHQIRFLHLLCVSVSFNQPKRYFIGFTSILEVIYHTYLCIFVLSNTVLMFIVDFLKNNSDFYCHSVRGCVSVYC